MIIRNFVYIFSFLAFISGCSISENTANKLSKELPVTIFVSNDFTSEPTHISVKITSAKRLKENEIPFEKIIVDLDFVESILSPASFKINLKEGPYFFLIETNNGIYKMAVSFEVDKPLWLYLVYSGENNFIFNISNHQLIWG